MEIKRMMTDQLSIEYLNIKDMLYNNQSSNKSLYHYKDFNPEPPSYIWQKAVNTPGVLKGLRLDRDPQSPGGSGADDGSVLYQQKSSRISINYLDKVAESWAKDGINTLQKAEEYIKQYESYYQETIAVLKYLGIHRSPSKAELDLYKNGRTFGGFPLNGILEACKETTKIQSPNMAYLDKILESLYKVGITSQQEIKEYLSSRDSINDKIKEVLFNLGYKNTLPTPEHQSYT